MTIFRLPRGLLVGLLLVAAGPGWAANFVVTKEADDNGPCEVEDCSFREALLAANANPGADTVLLAAGTYPVEIHGPGSLDSGSFDIQGDVEVLGEPGTRIVGDGEDRVLFIVESTVTLSHLEISGGAGDGWGGGIRSSISNLVMTDCTIRDNVSTLDGGGVAVLLGSLHLIRSTVVGNEAANDGGGVFRIGISGEPGFVEIINSTISGNTAYQGGGIGLRSFGPMTVRNSTIANNFATFRSTEVFTSSNAQAKRFTNTLIVGSCGFLFSSPESEGGNIESPGETCRFFDPRDRMNVPDAGIGPLAFNGGPTQTHALLPGSPALDSAIDASCESEDQRGQTRPVDGDFDGVARCDVGAFEASLSVIEIPTLSETAQFVLMLLLACAGTIALRR